MYLTRFTNLPECNGVHPDTSLLVDREEVNPMQKAITKGFTLIELLVVIAIIGILAAVVLVAINPAQRIAEAKDSQTKSDVGQVATALESCFTANQGSYAAGKCDSVTNLVAGTYLKRDTGDVTVTPSGTTAAIAYGTLTASSTACQTGTGATKYLVYRTSTGNTLVECSGSLPAVY